MELKFKHKFCYGIGNLGYSVVSQTITNFFMFFGTSVLKISGTLVGLAISIATIWDALTDPFVGYFSDNKKMGVFGNRCGYMLIGTIGISICNLLIWFVPLNISSTLKFLWATTMLLLNETFCTLFSTPYSALSGDFVCDYNNRTQIQIYKTIFFILGMIIPSLLMYVFLKNSIEFPVGQLNPFGYRKIAICCSLIMLVCGLICVFGTLKISKNESVINVEKFKLKNIFKDFCDCLKQKQPRLIIFGYCLSMASAGILTSVGMHFFTYCFFYSTKQITFLLLSLLLGMILGQPIWYKISLKIDKKPTLLSSLLLTIFGVVAILLVYVFKSSIIDYSFYLVLFLMLIVGIGAGALYSLPSSMYLDVIKFLTVKTGENKSGAYQSFLTFSYNISNAISLLIVGVLLDFAGFNSQLKIQSRVTQMGITIILFVGVLICLISSFIVFASYKLKKVHLEKIDKT